MTDIFTYGSNLAGKHGAGSAYEAMKNWGAQYGNGVGRCGNSYAIPTKDSNFKVLPIEQIKPFVEAFLCYARHMHDLDFKVVAIGCGLAGYEPKDIAPLFKNYPKNVQLPQEFINYLKTS